MNKFLELCEEYNPVQSESPKWKLIDFLKSKGVNVSLIKDTDMLYIDTGESTIAVNVDEGHEEEAESVHADYGSYNVNDEVENLAAKAEKGLKGIGQRTFGNNAPQAKAALKKRANVAKKAVDVYNKKTKKLEQDVSNTAI